MNDTIQIQIKQEKNDYFNDQENADKKNLLKQLIKIKIEEEHIYGFEEKPYIGGCYQTLNASVKQEGKEDIFDTSEIGNTKEDHISKSNVLPESQVEKKLFSIEPDQDLIKQKQTKGQRHIIHFNFEAKSSTDENVNYYDQSTESNDFRCPECGFKTTSAGNLSKHLKIKHNLLLETYQCQYCYYRTKSKTGLIKHFRKKHDRKQVYNCEQCDYETTYKPVLKRHYQRKHDVNSLTYKCGHCRYITTRKPSLARHIKIKHCAQTPTIKCPHCKYKTKWIKIFSRHMKAVHINKQNSTLQKPYFKSGTEIAGLEIPSSDHQTDHSILCKDEPKIEVSDCDFKPQLDNSFGSKTNSVQQILSSLNKIKSKDDENDLRSNNNSALNKVVQGNKQYTHPVPLDTKNIPNPLILLNPTYITQTCKSNVNINNTSSVLQKNQLESSLKENDESRQNNTAVITECGNSETFMCGFCSYKTGSKGYLSRHLIKEHPDAVQAMLTCEYCSYKCSCRTELKRHFKLKHDANTEVFKCAFCPFKTKYKPEFNRHYKLKHDESSLSFVCGFCSYSTKRKHSLTRHIKMKHDECTESLMCKDCDYTTKWKQSLTTHVKLKHCNDKPLQAIVIKDEVIID